jgi:hypothetical protein
MPSDLLKKDQVPWWTKALTLHFLDEPCLLGREHGGFCKRDWEYMPHYGFKSEDGEYIERKYSMEEIVPLEIVEHNKIFKRVWSFRGFTIK